MLRRASASFIAQIWVLLLTIGDRILLVGILLRLWGTDIYADWATLIAAVGLLSIGDLGLGIYFGNCWQRSFSQQKQAEFQRLIGISIFLYLVIGLSLACIAVFFVIFNDLSVKLSLHTLNSYTVIAIFLMLAGTQIITVMAGSISQIYRGRGEFGAGIMITSLSPLAKIILVGTTVLLGYGPLVAAGMYLLSDIIVFGGYMLFDLKRRFPTIRFRVERPTRLELKDAVNHAKWYAFLQGSPVAWLQIPVLIIGVVGLGGAALVSFLLIRTLVNFARQITEMLARSVGVEAAEHFHIGDKAHLAGTLSVFGKFLSGLTGIIIGASLFFAEPTIGFWSGDQDLYNFWILFWLIIPALLIAPALPLKNMLMLGNLPRPIGVASLLQIIIGLPLCYGLAKHYGVVGAVTGLAIGEILALGIFLPIVGFKHVGSRYFLYFMNCIFSLITAGAWSSFIAWSILNTINVDNFLNFTISGFLWGLFGFLPALFFITPRDKRTQILAKGRYWIKNLNRRT